MLGVTCIGLASNVAWGETIPLDGSCIQTVVDLGAGCSGVTACVAVQICV